MYRFIVKETGEILNLQVNSKAVAIAVATDKLVVLERS